MDLPVKPEIERMEEGISDVEVCNYLSYLWCIARERENRQKYAKNTLEIHTQIPILGKEEEVKYHQEIPTLKTELQSVLGDYIKIQPKSQDDNDNITKLLEIKKAQFYTIDSATPIKVVVKGFPIDTAITDIESDLIEQGIKFEKISQLRKFANKSLLYGRDQKIRRLHQNF
ncbi:hypothetical protein TNCT_68351 [Trichonephila clavata]|uniref:Uncharacterized protein n=1 Tax=Trichonephila clavata TaxID=2740835 RepID=A0A8X6G8H8_TRICU|nr:hypothetical protein TNCT_68351 [Trichonephila clavata]